MNPDVDSKKAVSRTTQETPRPPKRFRIEKLEERVAPTKGGRGTHNCTSGTANCTY